MLKDSLSLAGNVSQTLKQFCWSLVKLSIPQQFLKVVEKVEESSEWLFRDSIMKTAESLTKGKQLHKLLKDQRTLWKRKYKEQSSNSRFSSKSQFLFKAPENCKCSTHHSQQQTSSKQQKFSKKNQ